MTVALGLGIAVSVGLWRAPPARAGAEQTLHQTDPLEGDPADVHTLIIDETIEVFARGDCREVTLTESPPGVSIGDGILAEKTRRKYRTAVYTSRVIQPDCRFNEVVPSWNVDVPEQAGFIVELRLGRRRDGPWTPFYYLGRWGLTPRGGEKVVKDDHGVIDTDYFRSDQQFDRVQYRVHLTTTAPDRPPILRRFALVCSDTSGTARAGTASRPEIRRPPKRLWARRLPVPFHSQQRINDAELRGNICSPTCVAMVMEYRGVRQPTTTMARVIYDPEYEIYGNWARAVQGAYSFGVPGYLDRFSDWDAVKRYIADGQPVIASIRVNEGELRGAPYHRSAGHLLVITGFDEDGNVHVNDPAAASSAKGVATYGREEMEKVWFGRRGVGYVLLPAGATRGADSRPR